MTALLTPENKKMFIEIMTKGFLKKSYGYNILESKTTLLSSATTRGPVDFNVISNSRFFFFIVVTLVQSVIRNNTVVAHFFKWIVDTTGCNEHWLTASK